MKFFEWNVIKLKQLFNKHMKTSGRFYHIINTSFFIGRKHTYFVERKTVMLD